MVGGSAVIAVAALVAVALTACAGANPDSPANAQPTPKATVVLGEDAYHPARVRVEAGSRVTFVNAAPYDSNTAETAGAGFSEYDREKLDRLNLFDVHALRSGEAESVELDTPGTYRFQSSLTPDMTGVIEVVPTPE